LEIAEQMCDRVAIVNKGHLVASGTMEELRAAVAAHGSGPDRNGDGLGEDPADKKSLEDIFLELTGGAEYASLMQYLG
ncbi:MAG TPA: hypothetical protein VKT32_04055, partial [Chthonomonadaceae bacterium]|nr:hypothetical protein [Chthonomonadaceae bacterium]